MGYSILEYVLRCLRQQGLTADIAYPGQKFPTITGPVVTVHINSVDRANLLVDISTVLCASKVNVSSMNVHSTTDGFAIFYITISVTDAAQLEQVMRKLHQISSVMKVNRPAG